MGGITMETIKVVLASEIEDKIQPMLDQGYKVKSITPEVVSTAVATRHINGRMIIVLEK